MKYVDLSVTLNDSTPVYPGDPKIKISTAGQFSNDGYNDHTVTFGTHVGTHIDAPLHMVEGGKSIDEFPVEHFVGRGLYIDVRNGCNMDDIKSLEIHNGDIVILDTGMSRRYYDEAYFQEFTQIPKDVARYLVSCGIKIIGMDMGSPDHEPFEIHKIFLENDILIIENLSNLDMIKGKRFKIFALPIKLEIDGAPARVIAEIEEE